jgi:hypothetical protein
MKRIAAAAALSFAAAIGIVASPAQAADNHYRATSCTYGGTLRVTSWLNFQNPQFPRTFHVSATNSYPWYLSYTIFDGHNEGSKVEYYAVGTDTYKQVIGDWGNRSCIAYG